MIKLVFKLNQLYLLLHSLQERQPLPFPAWGAVKQELRNNYPLAFRLLAQGHPESIAFYGLNANQLITKLSQELKELIKTGLKNDQFARLEQETKRYLDFVQKQWQANKEQALKELVSITGLKLPHKTITVYLTHPKLLNGTNFPEFNIIGWGHSEDWENYSTVYLCHELLHILTASNTADETIMHALIELATDNELRLRLNGKGVYFKEGEQPVGHPQLLPLEQRLLPAWQEFLADNKGKNIIELSEKLSKQR